MRPAIRHKTCLALTFIALIAGMSTNAQSTGLAERFKRADRDGDGQLTRSELNQPALFQRLDRNGDGVITLPEVSNLGIRQRTATRRNESSMDKGLKMPPMPKHKRHENIRYDTIKDVDPNLLSLDLYAPNKKEEQSGHPVLIMIHGGGWRRGDKASQNIVGAKMRHFVGLGYIFVSINYRLSPEEPDPNGIKHPVHAQDCAKAVAWVHDNIRKYGGDPDQLHLMGHSAGAHLAGIVGTNERFLEENCKDLSILKSNVLLDTAAIDIPRYVKLAGGGSMTALYKNAFGPDLENWRDASPALHVDKGKDIPPTLIFYGGSRMLLDTLAPDFAESLTKAGSPSRAINTIDLNHGQINSHVGMVGEPMTKLIMRLHAGETASQFPNRLD